MIRTLHRSRQIDTRVGYDYKKQYFCRVKKNYHFFIGVNVDLCRQKKQRISPLRIGEPLDSSFKLKCKLCDFYTNSSCLYERHLSSNNHHIRMNQF
jgi:hypothetical protein